MPLARYAINDCCGSLRDYAEIDIPDAARYWDYYETAIVAAGYDPNEVCESCNDSVNQCVFCGLVET